MIQVGDRSSEVYLDEAKVVYCNGIQFQGDTLVGLKMELEEEIEQYVRHQGPIFPLKKKRGAKQKKDGGPEAEMKKAEAMRKQQEKIRMFQGILKGRGKDIEAARGGLSIQPFTGVHRWTMIFKHQPGRNGSCDAVGICSDGFRSFGPSSENMVASGNMIR